MNTGIPIPLLLKVGETRKLIDLGGHYITELTQEIVDVFLRGNSSYHIEMPSHDEVKQYEKFIKEGGQGLYTIWAY